MNKIPKICGRAILKPITMVMISLWGVSLQAQSLTGWNPVWSDEFTGSSIDMSKWEYSYHGDVGSATYTY